ncbi:MAG: ThiF family adenylyltransferase [Bacteroidia bacterium]
MNIQHPPGFDPEKFLPLFINTSDPSGKKRFAALKSNNAQLQVHDTIHQQLIELIKLRNPSSNLTLEEVEQKISIELNGKKIHEYGTWIFYPWNNRVVHLLAENEFIEVRTNRNNYKINKEERTILQSKKIGIIGLSVGQSVALTLAMERTCGEIRLADFDTLDLSNLNRLRTGVHQIGVPKVVIAAREIAEIDPYIHIKCYMGGITKDSIDSFIHDNGKLDLLIEVCDSLETKIMSRFIARKNKIPVLMETSDRGMLDVERFDLEPERKIFHGLIDEETNVENLSPQQRIQILMRIVSFENISERMKLSMNEIGKTISTWPQLASSVIMGGAVITDTSRRILLNQFTGSGRFYIDLGKLIS